MTYEKKFNLNFNSEETSALSRVYDILTNIMQYDIEENTAKLILEELNYPTGNMYKILNETPIDFFADLLDIFEILCSHGKEN